MPYFARFEKTAGHIFRFDTRIYLGTNYSINEEGVCIGAIIGKNPGSATSAQNGCLSPIDLSGDKMLPSVRNRFVDAYRKAGVTPPRNAFVRVWNLFYLCNKDLNAAISQLSSLPDPPLCNSEQQDSPPLVWYAWGGSNPALDQFKSRFSHHNSHCFYYDKNSNNIVSGIPTGGAFPKHPQGMPSKPVVNYLSDIITNLQKR